MQMFMQVCGLPTAHIYLVGGFKHFLFSIICENNPSHWLIFLDLGSTYQRVDPCRPRSHWLVAIWFSHGFSWIKIGNPSTWGGRWYKGWYPCRNPHSLSRVQHLQISGFGAEVYYRCLPPWGLPIFFDVGSRSDAREQIPLVESCSGHTSTAAYCHRRLQFWPGHWNMRRYWCRQYCNAVLQSKDISVCRAECQLL